MPIRTRNTQRGSTARLRASMPSLRVQLGLATAIGFVYRIVDSVALNTLTLNTALTLHASNPFLVSGKIHWPGANCLAIFATSVNARFTMRVRGQNQFGETVQEDVVCGDGTNLVFVTRNAYRRIDSVTPISLGNTTGNTLIQTVTVADSLGAGNMRLPLPARVRPDSVSILALSDVGALDPGPPPITSAGLAGGLTIASVDLASATFIASDYDVKLQNLLLGGAPSHPGEATWIELVFQLPVGDPRS